ncbi:hypothetical protein [Lentzea sp. CA-135723]|uniref:hypothetical protein n=1 Tax=Lentzea sp. CA-135723 TaxID=3239950 RepID=UPI003D8BCAC8
MNVDKQFGSTPIRSGAGDSPSDVSVPFWITACVRLMPPERRMDSGRNKGQVLPITDTLANAIFPAVQALIADRLRTEGEANAPLNRDKIARRCGISDASKARWIFDYLESIGFLRIRRHYAVPGRGRGYDTFTVFTKPPLGYVGPQTHAELQRAMDDPDRLPQGDLFVSETAGHTEHAGSGTFGNDQGAGSGMLISETAGHTEHAGSGTFGNDQGAGSGMLISETAGHTEHAGSGTFTQIDRSSISFGEGEIEGSMPVPGGAAMPPATGKDERLATEVRTVIRRLDWAAWKRIKNKPNFVLNRNDASAIEAAMCAAITSGKITLAEATEIACLALPEANGVVYLVRAFGSKLAEWTQRIQAEPLEQDTLPWRGQSTPSGNDHQTGVAGPEWPADGSNGVREGSNPRGRALAPGEAEVERLLAAGESGAERADQLLGTREWRAPERGAAGALEYVQVIVPRAAREFIEARRDALLTALSAANVQ